jgi:hypothetical protein
MALYTLWMKKKNHHVKNTFSFPNDHRILSRGIISVLNLVPVSAHSQEA